MIQKIKTLKLKNQVKLSKIIFNSLIRSMFDYSHVILNTGTQKISKNLQIFQNKILKSIKRFPIKTSISAIHHNLHIEQIESRLKKLFAKYVCSKDKEDLITTSLNHYLSDTNSHNKKFKTPFDNFLNP